MSTQQRGRSKTEQEALDRFFRGLPVAEAEEGLLIVANKADVKGAQRGDPTNCALAQSCKRLFDSTAALFFRTRAYIDLPNSKGNRVVRRFCVTPPVRDAIVRFDQTGDFPPGGFRLVPFPPSQTLEGARKAAQKRREAILKGERKPGPRKPGISRDGDVLAIEGVRHGTGMVHFTDYS